MNSEKITEQQNQITEEQKRKKAIKWLESHYVNSDDEELMDAFDNQNMPWACD